MMMIVAQERAKEAEDEEEDTDDEDDVGTSGAEEVSSVRSGVGLLRGRVKAAGTRLLSGRPTLVAEERGVQGLPQASVCVTS